MSSRSFLRAMLVGAAVVLAAVLAIAAWRHFTAEEQPAPAPQFDPSAFVRERPNLDAPYVATDYQVVDAMLAMAEVRPDDFVVDLGSGDGRILIAAAKSHGARGLGVDIDPARVREATQNARAAGVAHRVEFRRQDLFRTPLGEADVVTLYLTPEVNRRLRPRLLSQMRPGTKVVSHDFDMGAWEADQRQRIGTATIYLWTIPARVAGRWTVTVGGRSMPMELEQQYQDVTGRIAAGGEPVRIEQGRVAGPNIRFVAELPGGRRAFEGRVEGDRIVATGGGEWQAVRAG